MIHLNELSVARYVAESLSEQERLDVESHVAQCQDCLERIYGMKYLKEHFDQIWNSWSASEHRKTTERLGLLKIAKKICLLQPEIIRHVENWAKNIKHTLICDFKIFISKTHRVSSIAQESLPAMCLFKLKPLYAGIGTPEEQKQVEENICESSQLLSENDLTGCQEKLLSAIRIDPRAAESLESDVYYEQRLLLRIKINSARKQADILFWPQTGIPHPELAFLVPLEENIPPKAAMFEPVEDEVYLLAEFKHLSDGVYCLMLNFSLKSQ